jgi:DinB superfamily
MINEADLRYPIGQFEPKPFSEEQKKSWMTDIHILPGQLEYAILNLDEAQLDTPYRPQGWTIRQVVHHVADSHMNAFTRFKLALTEDNPTIKPYDEARWAELKDVEEVPINISITLLHALHRRWDVVINYITDEEWQRTLFHPEQKKQLLLWDMLGTYAWHGKHHLTHITALRERKGW